MWSSGKYGVDESRAHEFPMQGESSLEEESEGRPMISDRVLLWLSQAIETILERYKEIFVEEDEPPAA